MNGALAIAPFDLAPDDFEYFRAQIFAHAGISLSPAKLDLVRGRLRERATALGLVSPAEYRAHLEGLPAGDEEWQRFVNCLTTNKTDWFREPAHFEMLERDFLPRWLKSNKDCLEVWCAASSTGEEAYTLSLVLGRALAGTGRGYRILATDIDTTVLAQAANGVYPAAQVEAQVPSAHRAGFVRGRDGLEDWMKVRRAVRAPVEFARVNLVEGLPGPPRGFDLIFLRNVLIYFNAATAARVVEQAYAHAAPESLLVIAHAESLQAVPTKWEYRAPSLYRRGRRFA